MLLFCRAMKIKTADMTTKETDKAYYYYRLQLAKKLLFKTCLVKTLTDSQKVKRVKLCFITQIGVLLPTIGTFNNVPHFIFCYCETVQAQVEVFLYSL